ncbi:MAG: sulfatase-like hydrolase/transferase [Holophagales bacterium]|nr:sulfatase-like hydrolase/transferase [Holophagales bacterium]MYF05640.1 sulfatase-like hydrolase/transferase [Holophagales bacterium]MYJ24163.1 sulfatase-like hydrolase/transferase [Holophagales bacterium]
MSERQRPDRGDPQRPLATGLATIAGLSSLAFAQPLYDLLRRAPEFFAIRDLSLLDVLTLVVLLAIVPVFAFGLPVLLARVIRPVWTRPTAAAAAGLLTAIIALQALQDQPATAAIPAAASAGAAAAWAYLRFQGVRYFGLLLSAAAVVVPALLLIDSRVRQSAAFASRDVVVDETDTGARAPIVLVIFDEWSLTSILDRTGSIDRERLPNLAALADQATWYPNTTAAADVSELAVPAMLTGSEARRGQLPTAAEHPVNLFTLLAASHDLHVVEPITSLCPPQLNLLAESRQPARERLGLLVSDLSLVWLRLTLPSPWSDRLPEVTQTWSGFGREGPRTAVAPPTDQPVPRALFHLSRTDRAAEFRRFVQAIGMPKERPGFYFLHSMLPHVPWEYLPSGRRYETPSGGVHGLEREFWSESPWPVLHHRKRYLLQVEFLDRLIGELTARLESTGLFDRSLIVITADHGIAFRPGRSRRLLELTDLEGGQPLDLANVPLLVKAPFQQQPDVDQAPVSLAGLTPLILELAGAEEGLAPLPESASAPPTMVGKYAGEVEFAADRESWRQGRLAEQAGLLGESNDPMAIGARPELHGRTASDFTVKSSESTIELTDAWAWDHVDPDRTHVPALVEGSFDQRSLPGDPDVAVALNGVIVATVKPHIGPEGSLRVAAVVPEAGLAAGLNQVDVFLVSEADGDIELEHVQRARYPVYAIARDERGRIEALIRRSRSAQDDSPARFRVARPDPAGLFGNLDGSIESGFTLQGWAIDREDPGSVEEVVAFLAGRPFAVSAVALERPDVAARHGSEHARSGFLLRPPAGASEGQRFGQGESLYDALHREGVVAYAVSRRGRATRLRFSYQPTERGRRGSETMPVTDGRRLSVQPPGDGFDGSLDVVTRRNDATVLEGWAADLERGERPRQIVIYRDGEFLASLGINRDRPDVREHYDDQRLLRTGFRGEVPDAPEPATFGERHRVFAIMLRGAAVELPLRAPNAPPGEDPR